MESPAEGFEITEMALDDSVQFLLQRARLKSTLEMQSRAQKVVQALGYLPLALEQAAAHIHRLRNLDDFLATYEIHDERRKFLGWKPTGNYDHSHTVHSFNYMEHVV